MKTVPSTIYDKDYYLNTCFGSECFKKTAGQNVSPEIKELLSLIPIKHHDHILDIGCGRGDICLFLARKAKNVDGIDYSRDAIEIAQSILNKAPEKIQKKVHFQQMNAKKLTFADNSFDVIICIDVLEHLHPPEVTKMMKEISRVLKPGGYLLAHTGVNRLLYEYTYKYYIFPVNFLLTYFDKKLFHKNYASLPKSPRTKYELEQHVNEPTYFYLKRLFLKHNFYGKILIRGGYTKLPSNGMKRKMYNFLATLHPLSKTKLLSLIFGAHFVCIFQNKK